MAGGKQNHLEDVPSFVSKSLIPLRTIIPQRNSPPGLVLEEVHNLRHLATQALFIEDASGRWEDLREEYWPGDHSRILR